MNQSKWFRDAPGEDTSEDTRSSLMKTLDRSVETLGREF